MSALASGVRPVAVTMLLVLGLLAIACTGDDDDASGSEPTSEAGTPADGGDDEGGGGDGGNGDGDGDGEATSTPTPTEEPTPEPLPEVGLSWSMPARFGVDGNSDGFTDYACNGGDATFTSPKKGTAGDGCYEADATAFTVSLNACDNPAASDDATFSWTVAGNPLEATSCDVAVELAEGAQAVTVSASLGGELIAGPSDHTVLVEDILIVVVGDSWTVGIGAPDIEGERAAYAAWISAVEAWLDAQAASDRAAKAADAAAKALRDATIIFDKADAAADEAFDQCFTTFLGAPVIRIPVRKACRDAISDLGKSFIEDVTRLGDRIEDAVDDARRARDNASRAAREARAAAASAAAAAEAANDARKLADAEIEGEYQHAGCSRSANAGPAQAARIIEDADPQTSVTLVHLSCSGARVTDLIGGKDQINVAADVTGDRPVDLLLVGFGGNDLELNTILGELCVRQAECHSFEKPSNVDGVARAYCATIGGSGPLLPDIDLGPLAGAGDALTATCVRFYEDRLQNLKDAGIVVADAPLDTSARAWFEQLLAGTASGDLCDGGPDPANLRDAGLALRYDCAARQIADSFGDRLDPSRVVVWEYIDVAHDGSGGLCPAGIPEGSGNPAARSLPGFSSEEMAFLDQIFVTLNGEIASAAARHGWTFVSANASSQRHGYCAGENWIARVDQWLFRAPGASSLAHPTIDGMAYLGRTLAEGVTPILKAD